MNEIVITRPWCQGPGVTPWCHLHLGVEVSQQAATDSARVGREGGHVLAVRPQLHACVCTCILHHPPLSSSSPPNLWGSRFRLEELYGLSCWNQMGGLKGGN